MPSFFIVGYVWQVLGRRDLFVPHPWAAPKRPMLNRVTSIYSVNLAKVFGFLLTFWQILFICVSNFNLLSECTSSSFSVCKLLKTTLPILKHEGYDLLKSKWHLLWLAFIWLSESHLNKNCVILVKSEITFSVLSPTL